MYLLIKNQMPPKKKCEGCLHQQNPPQKFTLNDIV